MKWKRTACGLLTAGLLLTSAQAIDFSDTMNHWARSSISRWSDYGIVSGYTDGTFAPNKQITRAEMAVILSRTFGWQELAENAFQDISGSEWYAKDILRAKAAGVMNGDAKGNARPNDPITRQEAAVMISRALHIVGSAEGKAFGDGSQIGAWALPAINAMSEKGYISGSSDGNFYPNRTITRAETVTILGRAIANYYNKAGMYTPENVGITVIAAPGVTLQNQTIHGDLFITPGANDSDVVLYNVTVTGRTYIQSEEKTNVILSSCKFQQIDVEGSDARVFFQKDTAFSDLTVSGSGASVQGLVQGATVIVAEGTSGVTVNGRRAEPGIVTAGKDISTDDDATIDITIGGGSGGGNTSGSGNSGTSGGASSSGDSSSGGTTPTPEPMPEPTPTPEPDPIPGSDSSGSIRIDFSDLLKP